MKKTPKFYISLMILAVLLLPTNIVTAFVRTEPFGHNRRAITHHNGKRNNRITGTSLSVLESSNSNGFSNHFDMDELRERIKQESNPYDKLFSSERTSPKPSEVHIILFQPSTEDEGVHTIEYPKGSGNNIILAFESKLECDLFAANLKEQHFFNPSPYQIDLAQLEDECQIMGVHIQVVPTDMHIVPPAAKADALDHDPELSMKQSHAEYLFELEDATNHPEESCPPKGILNVNADAWE